jgi:hypothetical protein
MAEVKKVTLEISKGSSNNTRKVTVAYKLAFTPAEAGQLYQVAINLFGEDLPEDDEPAGSSQLLYTFTFGQALPGQNYQKITATAGEKAFSVSREVSAGKLDEDPGVKSQVICIPVVPKICHEVYLPQADEIYAKVSLTGGSLITPRTARSETIRTNLASPA